MPTDHSRINRLLVWVISLSLIAYFVLSPLTFLRETPQQVSPTPASPTTPNATITIPTDISNLIATTSIEEEPALVPAESE